MIMVLNMGPKKDTEFVSSPPTFAASFFFLADLYSRHRMDYTGVYLHNSAEQRKYSEKA